MKKVYNYMIVLDALNKYTKEKFVHDSEHDLYYSDSYEIVETDKMGLYELIECKTQLDTGIVDYWAVLQYETLADIIDIINKRGI